MEYDVTPVRADGTMTIVTNAADDRPPPILIVLRVYSYAYSDQLDSWRAVSHGMVTMSFCTKTFITFYSSLLNDTEPRRLCALMNAWVVVKRT